MSACTWNTSVIEASNGCCQVVAAVPTWISSGLTRTRFPAAALLPPHRPGEQVVHPQLPADLLRRLGGLLVLSRAAARDDLEPGQRRPACRGPRRSRRPRSTRLRRRPGSRTAAPPAAWCRPACRRRGRASAASRTARRARAGSRSPARR